MGCSTSNSQVPLSGLTVQSNKPAPPPPPIHLSQRPQLQSVSGRSSKADSETLQNEASIPLPPIIPQIHSDNNTNSISETERLTWRSTPTKGQHPSDNSISDSKCPLSPTSGRVPLCSDDEQQSMTSRQEERLSEVNARPICVPRLSIVSDADDEMSDAERKRESGMKTEKGSQTLSNKESTLALEASRLKGELKKENDGWDLQSMESGCIKNMQHKYDMDSLFDAKEANIECPSNH